VLKTTQEIVEMEKQLEKSPRTKSTAPKDAMALV